jgi:molybdate transport system substrate-binding protein
MKILALCLPLGAALLAATAQAAFAGDLKVLTAGAMRAVLVALVSEFEQQTGHRVTIENATAGVLTKRIAEGEPFDVAIITSPVVDELIKKGKIVPGSRVEVAKVGMGVVVKAGAALPDISTVEAFRSLLLSAKSVAYIDPRAGGSSGIYFDKLLDRLGVGEEVRAKAKLKQGGYVAELVANGEAEVGVHQISEILPVKGVLLAGPLPAEIQHTTVYAAGLSASTSDPSAARSLIEFFAGPAAGPLLKSRGMDYP